MSGDIAKPNDPATFRSWSGRVSGGSVIVLCATVAVIAVADPDAGIPAWVVAAMVAVAALAWAALVTPVVTLRPPVLRLRNAFTEIELPLHEIEQVAVRQFLVVGCGGRRFTCGAVGRSLRQLRRADTVSDGVIEAASYGAFAELRIQQAVEFARATSPEGAPTQVERRPRRVEIVAIALPTFVAVLLALL